MDPGRAVNRSSPVPLFYQVSEDLRRRLVGGTFRAGQRFTTVREVVREYAVSFVTAQRALARLADEGLVRSQRGRGTIVVRKPAGTGEARPDADAESATKRIVLLWPTTQTPGLALQAQVFPIVGGLRMALHDYTLALQFTGQALVQEGARRYLDSLATPENAGFCLLSAPIYVKRYFERKRLPTVVLGDIEPGIHLPFVSSNERKAHYDLTLHLISRGHRRIAQVIGMPRVAGHEDRIRGYREALAEAGIGDETDRRSLELTVPFDREVAMGQFRRLMNCPKPPTAAICTGSILASWLRSAAKDPLHVAYDVHSEPQEPPLPGTTLLIWPGEDAGYTAGRLLLAQIAGQGELRNEVLDYVRIQDYAR